MKRVVIIAALERELAATVRGWDRRTLRVQDRTVSIWECEHAVAACAGIGSVAARAATDAACRIAGSQAALVISAGLAGALAPELRVAAVVQPARVRDGVDGASIDTAAGAGTLVTSGALAAAADKRALARDGAVAVDMEAFAVADVARIYGLPFIALKAISDELDFPLPPLGRFISADGRFRTAPFVLWTVLRPWHWLTVVQLGRNSAAALRTLTQALEKAVRNQTQQP